ncbi:MAG: hypothetical protein ACRD47_14780 [Nitrososphaeraceae archaeon]
MELDRLRNERTQIVAECKLRPENIDCFYIPDRIPFNSTERSFIDKEWNRELKKKPSIFDGKLFHVNRQEFLLRQLLFHTCMSSFKEWIGIKGNKFKEIFRISKVIRPLSVGSMIVTSDNKWIIGRRQETYDFEGQYTLLAGYMDPDKDIVNSKPDPFFAIKREIEEETGINKNQDIGDVICLGANGSDQPYLAFRTHLRISYDELILNVPAEREFRKFEAYKHEKQCIKDFITSNYKELTPHTLANLLMSHDMLEL